VIFMKRVLVTGYNALDLDGASCSFAYAEFLKNQDVDAVVGIFEGLKKEAEYVFERFDITRLKDANKFVDGSDIILVDASDLKISDKIDPQQVIEIIDHRELNQADVFSKAKIQIEPVGAAATLVAEKLFNGKFEMSEKSAILLYSGIVSNTINFKSNTTTARDKKMAEWLLSKTKLPETYVHELFTAKSKFDKCLKDVFMDYYSSPDFGKPKYGIIQLEIIEAEKFVYKNIKQIEEILAQIKREQKRDTVFLTCIDIEKGLNYFVAFDNREKKSIESTLKVKFGDSIAKRNGIIMRKEINPLLKQYLEKK